MRPERCYLMKAFLLIILSVVFTTQMANAQKDSLKSHLLRDSVKSRLQPDSILLYNGQTLIGELKMATTGVITIDDIDLNLVKVKLYKIRRMVTHFPFRVETTDRKIYYCSLLPGEEDGQVILLVNDSTRISVFLTQINVMIPLEKSFLKRLTGNINAGFTYAKSSSVGQINFSTLVSYATRNWTFSINASEIASIDSSKISRDNENFELYGSYSFNAKWFAASSLIYQRNLELSIARRLQEMIGGGNKLFVKKYWQLFAISGLAFNQEKSTSGGTSGLLLEVPAMLRFNFYKFANPNLQITTTQAVYFGITQEGRIRWSGTTNFSYSLIKNFWLTFTPYTNFDNQPPLGGNTFDFGIALSFSYRF